MYDENSNSQNNKESTNSGMDRNGDAIHNDNYCNISTKALFFVRRIGDIGKQTTQTIEFPRELIL